MAKHSERNDEASSGGERAAPELCEPLLERVLVVDDEPNLRTVLCALLEREGLVAVEAPDGRAALEKLREAPFAAVITDLRMPGMDGLELLAKAQEEFPGLPVVLLTAHGTLETAVQALRRGAFDFLTKPFDREEVRAVVRKALASGLHAQSDAVVADRDAKFGMVGGSAALKGALDLLERVAPHDTPVLILGESGTGKELAARAIHELSPRRKEPFIKVNCAAIPLSLAESELFGHEKGAFSGAVCSRPGKFELADGGTLLLDEIGEMPLEMQPKILRALQEGEVERVGGPGPRKISVRVVAATNVDLARAVAEKRFREDLFYRLNVMPIRLPALRERVEDVPLLVESFLARIVKKLGRKLSGASPALVAALAAHPFPGNVRELENVVERMAILARGSQLELEDLPSEYRAGAIAQIASSALGSPQTNSSGNIKEDVARAVGAVERNAILKALEATGWNVTRSAERIGLSRKGLQLKLKEHGIRRPGTETE